MLFMNFVMVHKSTYNQGGHPGNPVAIPKKIGSTCVSGMDQDGIDSATSYFQVSHVSISLGVTRYMSYMEVFLVVYDGVMKQLMTSSYSYKLAPLCIIFLGGPPKVVI